MSKNEAPINPVVERYVLESLKYEGVVTLATLTTFVDHAMKMGEEKSDREISKEEVEKWGEDISSVLTKLAERRQIITKEGSPTIIVYLPKTETELVDWDIASRAVLGLLAMLKN